MDRGWFHGQGREPDIDWDPWGNRPRRDPAPGEFGFTGLLVTQTGKVPGPLGMSPPLTLDDLVGPDRGAVDARGSASGVIAYGRMTLASARSVAESIDTETAERELRYARFAFEYLADKGLLPAVFDFAMQSEGLREAIYSGHVVENPRAPGYAILAEAPFDGRPIVFHAGGISHSAIGNFETYVHEVLHRESAFADWYRKNPRDLAEIHAQMQVWIDRAVQVYRAHQKAVDDQWESRK